MEDIQRWVRKELWDQVPVSIGVIDRNFNIVEANHRFERNYGEWHNRPCYEVYKDRSERCKQCAAVETFQDGAERVREEEGITCNDEKIFYFVQMVPLIRENGEIPSLVEMSTDITTTKILEKEKLEAERLAAVGQTVASLAHGVKNVLMGLEGGMYVVNSGMARGDTDRISKGWRMLEENIARITSFVKEFLEFAKGRTPEVSLVGPNRLARKVIELFQDTAQLSGITLTGDLQEGIPYALMDEEAIHTCLANLVSNALDACQLSEKQNRTVTLSTRDANGILVFEVADDGIGIDYEIKKNIFANFFSTKGSDKGTGLGLLTTRKIVQEHGGKVSFNSTKGFGSVFRLEFPRDKLPEIGEEGARAR